MPSLRKLAVCAVCVSFALLFCLNGTLSAQQVFGSIYGTITDASGSAVVAQMKRTPTDDDAFGQCSIREDGRFMCPSYLFRVKKPGESTIPWDYYDLVHTTPADQTFAPLASEGCPLVKA